MFGSGREVFPEVRVVGMSSRMSGSGREALPDVRQLSGGPPGCPQVVGVPS